MFALRADFFARGHKHFMNETIAYAASKAVLFAPILVPVSDGMAIVAGLSILLGLSGEVWRVACGIFLGLCHGCDAQLLDSHGPRDAASNRTHTVPKKSV